MTCADYAPYREMARLPDDVCHELRRWCGDQGLHTELRTFLRHRLVQLVSKSGPPTLAVAASAAPDVSTTPLVLLGADLLRHLRLWYTHAVLSAEAGLSPQSAPADALLPRATVLRVAAALGLDADGVPELYAAGDKPLLTVLLHRARPISQPQHHQDAASHQQQQPMTELQLLQSRRRAEQLAQQQQERQLQQLQRQQREQLRQTRRRYRCRLQARLTALGQQYREEMEAMKRELHAERTELRNEVQRERAKLRKRAVLLDEREDLVQRRERRLHRESETVQRCEYGTVTETSVCDRGLQTEGERGQCVSVCDQVCQTAVDTDIPSHQELPHNVTFDVSDEHSSDYVRKPLSVPLSPMRRGIEEGAHHSQVEYVKTTQQSSCTPQIDRTHVLPPRSPTQAEQLPLTQSKLDAQLRRPVEPVQLVEPRRPAQSRRSAQPRRPVEPVQQRIISSLERRVADLETSMACSPGGGASVKRGAHVTSSDAAWRERQRAVLDSLLVTTAGLESQVGALQLTSAQLQLLPRPGQLQRPTATSSAPLPPPPLLSPPPPTPPPLKPATSGVDESDSLLAGARGRLAALSATAAELHRQFSLYQSGQWRRQPGPTADSVRRQLFQTGDETALGQSHYTTPDHGVGAGVTAPSREEHVEDVLRRSSEAALLSRGPGTSGRTRGPSPYRITPTTPPGREPWFGLELSTSGSKVRSGYLSRIPERDKYHTTVKHSSLLDRLPVRSRSSFGAQFAASTVSVASSVNTVSLAGTTEPSATKRPGQDWNTIGVVTSSPSPSRLRWLLSEALEPTTLPISEVFSEALNSPVLSKAEKVSSEAGNNANTAVKSQQPSSKEVLMASVIGEALTDSAYTVGLRTDRASTEVGCAAALPPLQPAADLDSLWKPRPVLQTEYQGRGLIVPDNGVDTKPSASPEKRQLSGSVHAESEPGVAGAATSATTNTRLSSGNLDTATTVFTVAAPRIKGLDTATAASTVAALPMKDLGTATTASTVAAPPMKYLDTATADSTVAAPPKKDLDRATAASTVADPPIKDLDRATVASTVAASPMKDLGTATSATIVTAPPMKGLGTATSATTNTSLPSGGLDAATTPSTVAAASMVDLDSEWRPRKALTPHASPPSEPAPAVSSEKSTPVSTTGGPSKVLESPLKPAELASKSPPASGTQGLDRVAELRLVELGSGSSTESLPVRPRHGSGSSADSAERSGALLRSALGYSVDPPSAAADMQEEAAPSSEKTPVLPSAADPDWFPFPTSDPPPDALSMLVSPPQDSRASPASAAGSGGRRQSGGGSQSDARKQEGDRSSPEQISGAAAESDGDSDFW